MSRWIINPTCPRKTIPLSSFRAHVRLLSARFPLKEKVRRHEVPARRDPQGGRMPLTPRLGHFIGSPESLRLEPNEALETIFLVLRRGGIIREEMEPLVGMSLLPGDLG